MSTITAFPPASRVRVTRFERLLLTAAAGLDAFVAARLEKRAQVASRAAAASQERYADARRAAQARGAAGLLPR
ncbi:hypothetical protein AB1K54_12600 [Microbacterium sp. BWT-B31]|uniref:hypothetical protein n=1 Tax=Microbacterium sp. BWT-B31 TaxID=3232072 RepID=UPI0035276825